MEKTGLNILFILPEYYPHSGGGISTYYLHYIKSLAPYTNKIKVIVGSGYSQGEDIYELDKIQIEYLKPQLFNKYLNRFKSFDIYPDYQKNIAAAWAMWEQCNKGEAYDIIECTDFGLGYIPWIVENQKPVVTRLHGSNGQIEINEPNLNNKFYGDIDRLTELTILSRSNSIITHSKANQAFWSNIFQSDSVNLIYPVYLNRNQLSNAKKLDSAMVCGRIQEWKGPDVLCKALQVITYNTTPIKWFGRDTNFDHKKSKNDQLENDYPNIWKTRISVQNPLPHQELINIQQQAKFGIVPSTWDMFNFTCLEFLCAGVPVICSKHAGASDLITDGVNGYTYTDNDPLQLASLIEKMTRLDHVEYQKMSDSAFNTIIQQLSAEKLIPMNLAVYEKTLNNFEPKLANKYISTIYNPTEQSTSFTKILDQKPLKTILGYTLNRLRQKINLWAK